MWYFNMTPLDVASKKGNSEIISIFSPVRGVFAKLYNEVTSLFEWNSQLIDTGKVNKT